MESERVDRDRLRRHAGRAREHARGRVLAEELGAGAVPGRVGERGDDVVGLEVQADQLVDAGVDEGVRVARAAGGLADADLACTGTGAVDGGGGGRGGDAESGEAG